MIADNITVSYGELKKGKSVDLYTNPGIEWAFHIQGRGKFTLDGQTFLLEAGDSICFNSRLEHSLTALEK
jgi:quercetin dioxygenase-like cupin family protein